jgi:hypothetical protein
MNINPENKDALSGSLFTGGKGTPANPVGYNGSPLAAFKMAKKKENPKYYEDWFKSPADDTPGQKSLWEVTETPAPRTQNKAKETRKSE